MPRRNYFACLVLAAIVPVDAIAQQQQIDTADAVISEPESDPIVSPFADDTASFATELSRTNYLDAGLSVTGSFDDNVLSESTNTKSDMNYLFMPNVALRQSRGRWDWRLNYQGGYSAYQRFNAYDQASHDFGVNAAYKLAPHVEVDAENDFRITTGFFNQINQGAGSFSGTILEQPNQSVITPIARQNEETARVHLNDQFSEVSAIGASTTFFSSRYKDVPAGAALIDTTTQEAEAYYNRQVTRTSEVGITYRFQRFSFSQISNDTTANSVLGTYTFRPRPTLALTVFGGPQYVDTTFANIDLGSTTPPTAAPSEGARRLWSEAGGVSLAWNGLRTGIALSAVRDTSDGGGLLGAVTFTGGKLVLRRQLLRNTTVEVGSRYGLSEPLVASASAYRYLRSLSAEGAITREFSGHWSVSMGYAHAVQYQGVWAAGTPQIGHNRAWTSVSYQFSRPLGNE